MEYATTVAKSINAVTAVSAKLNVSTQKELLEELCDKLASMSSNTKALEKALENALNIADADKQAAAFRKEVFAKMFELRANGDALEKIIAAKYWPLPTYGEMLFIL